MSKDTGISWCDHTFNVVWGCSKITAGCKNCYAETLAARWGFNVWGVDAERRTFGDRHWNEPLKWQNDARHRARVRRRVFCSSMADVFEDHPTTRAQLPRLWALIRATPDLDWLLLTKRPERIAASLPDDWAFGYPNVWLGTSVENADVTERIHSLAAIPAAVRWISAEPLLGSLANAPLPLIDWVVAGGESGPDHRAMDLEWLYDLRDRCARGGIAFFVKQDSGSSPGRQGRIDDETFATKQFPLSASLV